MHLETLHHFEKLAERRLDSPQLRYLNRTKLLYQALNVIDATTELHVRFLLRKAARGMFEQAEHPPLVSTSVRHEK
jgi:hypothetical protein